MASRLLYRVNGMPSGPSSIVNISRPASKPEESRPITILQLHLCIHSPINANPSTAITNLWQTRAVLAEVANDGDILVATTCETARAVNGWRFRSL
jgi:hypothetical protein